MTNVRIGGHKNGKETESALLCKAMSFILHFSQLCFSSESVVVDIGFGVGGHLCRYHPTGQIEQRVGYRMLSIDAAHRYSRTAAKGDFVSADSVNDGEKNVRCTKRKQYYKYKTI